MGFNVFAVTPASNSDGRGDATGAFIPGATRFARAYGGSFRTFNNLGDNPKRNFLRAIQEGPGSLDVFAYFGHGWRTQLGSAHIYTDRDMDEFADALRDKLKADSIVVLYACWAGVAGGFSTMLQQKIGRGVWVYAHTSAGHSFANPDVSEVQQSRDPRYRLLYRNELRVAWNEALHYTDMWLRFPVMSDEYVERELNAIRLLGRWRVPESKTYMFQWSRTTGTYDGLASLNRNPDGTVRDVTGGRRGTWTIRDDLELTWNTGESETWSMPLNPTSQSIEGLSGSARRMVHTLPGRPQT